MESNASVDNNGCFPRAHLDCSVENAKSVGQNSEAVLTDSPEATETIVEDSLPVI